MASNICKTVKKNVTLCLPLLYSISNCVICVIDCHFMSLFTVNNLQGNRYIVQYAMHKVQNILFGKQCAMYNSHLSLLCNSVASGRNRASSIHDPLNRADIDTLCNVSSGSGNRENVQCSTEQFSEVKCSAVEQVTVQLLNLISCDFSNTLQCTGALPGCVISHCVCFNKYSNCFNTEQN